MNQLSIKEKYLVLLIALVCSLLIAICTDEGHNWGGDFALYIAQAKALGNASIYELYEVNKYAMDNSTHFLGPYLYPMGFPLLLTPAYFFSGADFIVMKGFCGLFLILSIPLMHRLFKGHFPNSFFVFFIIVFIAFNAIFITFSDAVLSDLPFFFFSMLALFLMSRKNTMINQGLLGVCILFSYLIRDIGIVLLPTLFIYQLQHVLFRKEDTKQRLYFAIPYLVFAAGFIFNYYLIPRGGQNHVALFLANLTPEKMITNTVVYLKLTDSFFINGIVPDNALFLKLAFIPVLIAIGMLACWRTHLHLVTFIALTFMIIVIWPFLTLRFLFPVIPFFVFFLLKGILFLSEKTRLKQPYLIAGLSIYLVVFLAVNLTEVIRYSREETNAIYTPEMLTIYGYIKEHIPQGQAIGFKKPRVLRLITEVKSIEVDESTFEASPAQYLVIEKERCTGTIGRYDKMFESANYIVVRKPPKKKGEPLHTGQAGKALIDQYSVVE